MKAPLVTIGLLMVLPVQAEIFKCSVNGSIEFSDATCSSQAEKVTLDIKTPDPEAVESQQAITETFEEESRMTQIHALHEKNDELEARIAQLQQQRRAELGRLRQKTYSTGDGRIATREYGLFEKMDQVDRDYQQQVDALHQQILLNEQQLNSLYK